MKDVLTDFDDYVKNYREIRTESVQSLRRAVLLHGAKKQTYRKRNLMKRNGA